MLHVVKLTLAHNACLLGLVSLGSVSNDCDFGVAYTISNLLVLGGHAEPRHRVRIRQILTLPRLHQGESTSRFKKKVQLRRKFLRIFLQKRQELFANAWRLSDDNEVRNRWIRLARAALDEHRKQNPQAEDVRVSEKSSVEKSQLWIIVVW